MKNQEWANLIKSKREQLIEVGEKAYRDAMENQHMRFAVLLYDDGEVDSFEDIAGGNSYTMSEHNGEAINIIEFCFQYKETEVTDNQMIEKLQENEIAVDMKSTEEEYHNLTEFMMEEHIDLYNEIEVENIEWDINEYAYEQSIDKIDYYLEQLDRCDR